MGALDKKATNIELKKINRNKVYRAVMERKETSKQELAYLLNLSLPTVAQNLNELMEQGLVLEKGSFQSTGGRKARIISGNPAARAALGLDITRNHINLVLADLDASILRSARRKIAFSAEPGYFEEIREMIRGLVREAEIEPERILGVGVSLPAIIGDDGKTVRHAVLLNYVTDLYEKLASCMEYPYHLINDANAGGFAELCCGGRKETFLYLQLSNTVGGAILLNGKVYLGDSCLGGEFGHTTLVPDGRPCYCGCTGCVDAYCSALVLADAAGGNLESFFDKLRRQDESCKKIWEEYLHYLAIVINNLRVSFDCDVVLGGYVGRYLEPYLGEIRRRAAARCAFQNDGSYLQTSRLGAEASALGAALSYIRAFMNQV